MKINFGAGRNWQKENWSIVDHNIKKKRSQFNTI